MTEAPDIGICFDRTFPASAVSDYARRAERAGLQELLAGRTLSTTDNYVTANDVALEHIPDPVPAVVAGVRGPKSLAMAGRCADGVLLDSPCTVDYLRQATMACGRDADDFAYRCFAMLCVLPDRQEARRAVAPFIAEMIGNGHAGLAALPFHDELHTLIERHDIAWADHAPDDWWTRIGAIGTVDDALAYVGAMSDAGVNGISFFPSDELEVAHGQLETAGVIARELHTQR